MRIRRCGGLKHIAAGLLPALLLMVAGAAFGAVPNNDNCANAFGAQIGYYYTGYTDEASVDGVSSCPDTNSPDVWFSFSSPSNTRVAVYTCGEFGEYTLYDTAISLHTGCPGSAANELACNDDSATCGDFGPSYMEADVQGGATYYIRVSGYNNGGTPSTGYYVLSIIDLGGGATPTPSPSPSPSPTGGVNTPSPTPSPTGGVNTPSPSPSPTPGGVSGSDNCADAPSIQPDTVYSGSTASATLDGVTTCQGSTGPDVWLKFTATESKNLNFNLCNVDYDAVMSIHSGCPGTAANTLACSDDGCGQQGGGGYASGPVQAGTTYYIRISGYNGAKGNYQFVLEDPNPNRPEIQINSDPLRFSAGKPKIHVEIDWMQDATHNYQPEQAVLDAITDTFAQAGFEITLELSNAIPYQAVIQIDGAAGVSGSPQVQAIKNAHFNHINDSNWSYSIWGDNYGFGGDPTGSSGIADLPGSTFLVTLGSFPNGVGLFSHKVGTFVHEFGHTMGQKHGGIDNNNWKPNYISIMNYFYQLDGIPASLTNLHFATNPTGFNTFGYSSGGQPPLDENNLNENVGLGLNQAIDWNCNSVLTDTGVQKDIGGAGHSGPDWCQVNGSKEVLTDFDNWNDIPNFIRLGLKARNALSEAPQHCITWNEYSALHTELELKAAAEGRTLVDPPTAETFSLPPVKNNSQNPQTFTIQNVGQQPLEITSIDANPAAPYLTILSPSRPFTIQPQSQQAVTVSVNYDAAPAGESTTRLVVASNDADENPYPGQVYVITRNLTGGGATPSPSPTPAETDGVQFVSVGVPSRMVVGTSAMVAVNVRNTGTSTWSYNAGHALTANDPCGLMGGNDATLYPDETVAPGAERSFLFTFTAGSTPGTCSGAFSMRTFGGNFGPSVPFSVLIAAQETSLANNPEAWFSGIVEGTGTVETNGNGLCAGAPALGDNIAGWVSPNSYIPLADQTIYQIRLGVSSTQTEVNKIPLLSVIYDNAPYLTYGGELIAIDVADGANGIGRPQGITTAELWATPNAMNTQQWRGLLPGGGNENSMFTPRAEIGNDMRLVFRLLDTGSAGVNANIDEGTICISSISVRARLYGELTPLDAQPVWGPPLSSTQHAAETFDQVGGGTAQIDDVNHIINYQLTADGVGSRKTLIPYDQRPEAPSALYPIDWLGNTLYRATVRVRSNVGGPGEGSDPLDVLGINFDTRTVELVNTHVTLRGTIDYARFAASPRLAATTGGEVQSYVAYFYSHNRSALPPAVDPQATRFRAMADFLNFAVIAPEGQGADPFTVTDMMVERVNRP